MSPIKMSPARLWPVKALEREKRGMRSMLQVSVAERDQLQRKLKERHLEVLQLLDALDRQKVTNRELNAQRHEQSKRLEQALERIETLRSENLHLRRSSEIDKEAAAKHSSLLKQQVADRSGRVKLLEQSLTDSQREASEQRRLWESKIAAEGKRRGELETMLQDKIDELASVKTSAREREDELSDRLAKMQSERATLQGELKSLEGEKERNTKLEKEIETLRERNTTLTEDYGKASERAAHLEGELKIATGENLRRGKEITTLTASLADATRKLTDSIKAAEQRRVSELKAADVLRQTEAKEATRRHKEEIEKITTRMTLEFRNLEHRRETEQQAASGKIAQLDAEIRGLECKVAMVNELRANNAELKELETSLRSDCKRLRDEVKSLASGKASLEGEHKAKSAYLQNLEIEAKSLNRKLESATEKLIAALADAKDAHSRNAELERQLEQTRNELLNRVTRNDRDRNQCTKEFTQIFGELRHNETLAAEREKRINEQTKAYNAAIEAERLSVRTRVDNMMKGREVKLQSAIEKARDDASKAGAAHSHLRSVLDCLSKFYVHKYKAREQQDLRRLCMARWQVGAVRRKWARELWKRIMVRRLYCKASRSNNKEKDFGQTHRGGIDDLQKGENSGMERARIDAGAVAGNTSGAPQPEMEEQKPVQDSQIDEDYDEDFEGDGQFGPNEDPGGIVVPVRGSQRPGSQYDAATLEQQMRLVGKMLLQGAAFKHPEDLDQRYHSIEAEINRYSSHLSNCETKESEEEKGRGRQVGLEREIAAFEKENARVNEAVAKIIRDLTPATPSALSTALNRRPEGKYVSRRGPGQR